MPEPRDVRQAPGRATAAGAPRPPGRARYARREAILDAALGQLERRGYRGTSMASVAAAARTSKETLYGWFGDKQGLFGAVVEREAAAINEELAGALGGLEAGDEQPPPEVVLTEFGRRLLTLLLGSRSLAINRAAIAEAASDAEFGRILAAGGRENTGRLVRDYLAAEHERARLEVPDPQEAFETFLGLLVRDLQMRVLMGAQSPPSALDIDARAAVAVAAFMRLHGPRA